MTEAPLYFLVAGEASGDLLGARLMHALKKITNGHVRFAGVGGPRMMAEGIELLFPQHELAHMGFFELIVHLPRLIKRIGQTVLAIVQAQPQAVITIDAPDFCFRVAGRLRKKGFKNPLIHYVAPTVWAWRPKRAKKIARLFDHLLALLPFEPPYFTKENLPCTFVGHSIIESGAALGSGVRFRRKYGLAEDTPLLMVLPGSRRGEVRRLLPIFTETVSWVKTQEPRLHVIVPTVPSVAEDIKKATSTWGVPVVLTETDEDKYDAMAASFAALACSGTITIELAMAQLPTVVAYKISSLTYALYRRFIRVKYATLANIMQDRMVMPEYIQSDCTARNLALGVYELYSNPEARVQQKESLKMVSTWLGQGQFIPSERAAQVVLDVVGLHSKGPS